MNYAVGWNQPVSRRTWQVVNKRKKSVSLSIVPAIFLFAVLMLQLHVRLNIVAKTYEVEQLRESIMQKQDRIREVKLSLEKVSEPDFIMQIAKSKLNLGLTPPQRIRKITVKE